MDEPITNLMGESRGKTARTELKLVTLRHLLHHRSGIPNYACSVYRDSKLDGRLYWTTGYSEAQLIQDINGSRLAFTPGSKFEYSNSGYAVIGFLCQKASGLSYEELMKKYVSDPIGLASTCIVPSGANKLSLTTPYYPNARTKESKPSDWGMVTPSSGIYSNANDLSKLMVRQLSDYRSRDSKDTYTLNLTEHTGPTNSKMTYGFGLFRNPKQGYANYLHGGNADGYSCAYVFSPEENVGLVLLSSSGGHCFGQLEEEIYHKMTGEKYPYVPERKSLAQAVFDVAAERGIESAVSVL